MKNTRHLVSNRLRLRSPWSASVSIPKPRSLCLIVIATVLPRRWRAVLVELYLLRGQVDAALKPAKFFYRQISAPPTFTVDEYLWPNRTTIWSAVITQKPGSVSKGWICQTTELSTDLLCSTDFAAYKIDISYLDRLALDTLAPRSCIKVAPPRSALYSLAPLKLTPVRLVSFKLVSPQRLASDWPFRLAPVKSTPLTAVRLAFLNWHPLSQHH